MAFDSDSDEEDSFFPVPKNFGGVIEEEDFTDYSKAVLHSDTTIFINHALDCVLYRDVSLAEKLMEQVELSKEQLSETLFTGYVHICELMHMLLNGNYLDLVTKSCHNSLVYTQLMAHTQLSDLNSLKEYVHIFIASASDSIVVQLRVVEVLIVGVAYLELFCQMNYTGPELPFSLLTCFKSDPNTVLPAAERVVAPPSRPAVPLLGDWGGAAREVEYLADEALELAQRRFHAGCIAALEVDGEYPYSIVEIPVCLVLSRVILCAVASPEFCLWHQGVHFKVAPSSVVSTFADAMASTDTGIASVADAAFAAAAASVADMHSAELGETESVYTRTATIETMISTLAKLSLPQTEGGNATSSSLKIPHIHVLKKSLDVFAAPLAWFSARSVVTHLRLIMYAAPSNVSGRTDAAGIVTVEKVPTLWCESQDLFKVILPMFGNLCGMNHSCAIARMKIEYISASAGGYFPLEPVPQTTAAGVIVSVKYTCEEHLRLIKQAIEVQCWLEYGLLMYYFNTERQGKKYFDLAKQSAQLVVTLTGAMGKKTKYQKDDFAQLYVHTESELMYLTVMSEKSDEDSATKKKQQQQQQQQQQQRKQEVTSVTVAGTATAAVSDSSSSTNLNDDDVAATEAASGALRFEIGKHIMTDTATGDEVAVREVTFDNVAEGGAIGGYDDNIYFNDGVHYTDNVEEFRSSHAAGIAGGKNEEGMREAAQRGLHYVDEAVVLALCLDVANSNPADGLTNEEMVPYVQCVLNRAIADKKKKKSVAAAENVENVAISEVDPPNWMIYSTALLQRSWIEFEKGRTMDRAMLQIQALIDQHSTKLTVMQPTHEAAVEQSAPVQDRIRYLFSIVYPPQYELKAELAQRYLTCGVYNSALAYFKELQMWDDVVACYQLLEKPHRAEILVRERLACTDGTGGETPYMLTALGDITQKPEYYERAWEISGGRYARAKRTLGRMCFDKARYKEAIEHFSAALAVQPATANIWYMKGVACMRIDSLDDAIEAFVRCNNQQTQENEFAEAYSNLGAIYVQRQMYTKGHAAFVDALRLSRDNWKIIENLMLTTLVLGNRVDCIGYMQKLLDLRHKSHRPVHVDELHRLCFLIGREQVAQWRRDLDPANDDRYVDNTPALSAEEKLWAGRVDCTNPNRSTRALGTECKKVITLLYNITNAIKSSSQVWDIFAELMYTLGYYSISVNFRLKQIRAYLIEYSEIYKHRVGGSEHQTVVDFFEHTVHCVENTVETLQTLQSENAALPSPRPEAARLVMESKSLLKTLVQKFQTEAAPALALPNPPTASADRATTDESATANAAPKQVRFSRDELEQTSEPPVGATSTNISTGTSSVFGMEDASRYINTIMTEISKLD